MLSLRIVAPTMIPQRNPKVWATTEVPENADDDGMSAITITITIKITITITMSTITTYFYPHANIGARLQNQTQILGKKENEDGSDLWKGPAKRRIAVSRRI